MPVITPAALRLLLALTSGLRSRPLSRHLSARVPLSGWFCCAQPVNLKVTLEVLTAEHASEVPDWQPVNLPSNVKALIVLNLQVPFRGGGARRACSRGTAGVQKAVGLRKFCIELI